MPRFTTLNPILSSPVDAHCFDGTWFNGRFLSEWAQSPGVVWHDDFTMSVQTPAGEKIAKKYEWLTRNEDLEFNVVGRGEFDANYKPED